MVDDLILIKLGGSVLTDKTRKQVFRGDRLVQLVSEIAQFRKAKHTKLIIAHGAGSFGHEVAAKYHTKSGLLGEKANLLGMAEVASVAQSMNNLVVSEFIKQDIPAVSISPRSCLVTNKQQLKRIFVDSIQEALAVGVLPVLFGDVVMDKAQGWTIFSSENVLAALAGVLKTDFQIKKLLLVSDTDGVYDKDGKTIPEITEKNFTNLQSAIGKAQGFDVTGGMRHKVETALNLAKEGVTSQIINGTKSGTLHDGLSDKEVKGTIIR